MGRGGKSDAKLDSLSVAERDGRLLQSVSHSEGRHAPQNNLVTHKTGEDSVTVRFQCP